MVDEILVQAAINQQDATPHSVALENNIPLNQKANVLNAGLQTAVMLGPDAMSSMIVGIAPECTNNPQKKNIEECNQLIQALANNHPETFNALTQSCQNSQAIICNAARNTNLSSNELKK